MRAKVLLASVFVLLFKVDAKAAEVPYLGVMVKDDEMVRVIHVIPDSPAHKADLRPGDIIASLNHSLINNAEEAKRIFRTLRPNQKIKVVALRGSNTAKIKTIQLSNRDNHPLKKIPYYEIKEWSSTFFAPTYPSINGSPAIFYFTATWCPPCKTLAPMISKMYLEMERSWVKKFPSWNKPLPLHMAAVAWAESVDDKEDYLKLVKLQTEQAFYPFGVMLQWNLWNDAGVKTVPTVIVVDQDGYIVGRYGSRDLIPDQCATLRKEIEYMLNQDPSKKLNLL